MKTALLQKAFEKWMDAADEVAAVYEGYDPRQPDSDLALRWREAICEFDKATRDVLSGASSPENRRLLRPYLEKGARHFTQERKAIVRWKKFDSEQKAGITALFLADFDGKAEELAKSICGWRDLVAVAAQIRPD